MFSKFSVKSPKQIAFSTESRSNPSSEIFLFLNDGPSQSRPLNLSYGSKPFKLEYIFFTVKWMEIV